MLKTVFKTPVGRVNYTGRFRYLLVIRRRSAPANTPFTAIAIQRSDDPMTLVKYCRSKRDQLEGREIFILDTRRRESAFNVRTGERVGI